jgi:small GTP-binding protein
MSIISKKICLIGDFGVGKTSLIRRFVEQQFSDKYLSTVGVKISRKSIKLSDNEAQHLPELQLLIWDIEGSNKFKAIAPSYFQGAKGAIIVGDVTREETLIHLTEHIQNFLAVNPNSYIIIALNKSDLIEAEHLANIHQMYQFKEISCVLGTYITSAKTGSSVDELFQKLAFSLIQ